MEDRLEKIEKKLDELAKLFDKSIINKAIEYDKMKSLLDNINIKAEVTQEISELTGENYVKVEYSIAPTIITCSDEGEIDCDKQFYSINMLDLINIETMQKIQDEINFLKKVNFVVDKEIKR